MGEDENRQEVKPKKEDFFELIINNPNHASPFLQFGWCVNERGILYLQEKKVLHPFLLVVVLRKKFYGEEWVDYERYLYPLDQGLGHIEFSRPGKYIINASVVWSDCSSGGFEEKIVEARESIYDKYIKITNGKFDKMLHDGLRYRSDYLDHSVLPCHDEVIVLVDENLFAPEPSERLKWWVNMFWVWKKPENQCEWRRRSFFAFSIQPFLVLLWLVLRSVIAVGIAFFTLCIGFYPKEIGWKAIFHPLDMNLSNIVDGDRLKDWDNYWWVSVNNIKHLSPQKIFSNMFVQLALVIFFGFILSNNMMVIKSVYSFSSLKLLLISLFTSLMFFLAMVFVCEVLMFVFGHCFGKKLEKFAEETSERRLKEEIQSEKEHEAALESTLSFFYDQRLRPLACTKHTRKANFASLPKSHQTIKLRFIDAKAKVCKIFRH